MVNATDIAYVKFKAPDLDKMEAFLIDFGLNRARRTDTKLYMHGTGTDHYIHVTELGEPEFIGFALNVDTINDLERLSKIEGVSEVHDLEGPGGGSGVVMSDPDGFEVEAICGTAEREPVAAMGRFPINMRSNMAREGKIVRYDPTPSHVKRLGHVVLSITDFNLSQEWYRSRFGLLVSDDIVMDDNREKKIAAFLRCNKSEDYVDHHTVLIAERVEASFNHCAYEVEDIDDLQIGHDYLSSKDHKHYWGVGRHFQGSQIFDYWMDPWGRTHEHWTDGDLLNEHHTKGQTTNLHVLDVQWGQKNPIIAEMRSQKKEKA